MDKGKRMNKIALTIIVVLVIAVIVGVVIYVQSIPKERASENVEFERQQVFEERVEGDAEMTLENKDYVENQVIAVADSKREAKKIAKAIGGELISYENQVAIIQIGITVEEMMQKLEEDPSLPKVYPNYQNYSSF